MPSRIDVEGYSDRGKVRTQLIDTGALSADPPGRAIIADEFFSRDTLRMFAKVTFPATVEGRSKFGKKFVDTGLLDDGCLAATVEGRRKMASEFLSSESLDKFAINTFTADVVGRSKFEDEFIATHLLRNGVLSADVHGRAKIATDFFDVATVDRTFEDHSIHQVKLIIDGEDWDFTSAASVKAPPPVEADDVVTKGYLEEQGGTEADLPFPQFQYYVLDPIADAVPGQDFTYYIAKGATAHGVNIQIDLLGRPMIWVLQNGRQKLWTAAGDLGSETIAGDFTVVQSQSTGAEGPAPAGWLNAIQFAAAPVFPVWYHFKKRTPDLVQRMPYRQIDTTADAVEGQARTFYIDKGTTTYGQNTLLDPEGKPRIRVRIDGLEKNWVPEADLGDPLIAGDFTVVRSQSTGVEGPAPEGSLNAITLDTEIAERPLWVDYYVSLPDADGWSFYRRIDTALDAVPDQALTYYIDKGATSHGYNVKVDVNGVPEIYLIHNGREKFWVPEAGLGHPTNIGDFSVVRSLSSGAEGPAAEGSLNAVKLALAPEGSIWLHYRREGPAVA